MREYHAAKVEANELLAKNSDTTMSHAAAKIVADVGHSEDD